MLSSIFGVFFILVFSTGYILFSAKKLQTVSDTSFDQQRFLKSLQEDLAAYQNPLLEYLSTSSSNALGRVFIAARKLRDKLPADPLIIGDKTALKERELYALIRSYLDLAEEAMEEKRGRNIAGYTKIYDEMSGLLEYISREIEAISAGRFRGQLDVYGLFIADSGTIQFWNFLFIIGTSMFAVLLLLQSVRRITNPLVRLSVMAAELSAGHFDVEDIEIGSVQEMNQVVEAFNRMKTEIRNYIAEIRLQETIKQEYMQEKMRNLKMEGLLRHMEIYTLQAQMNPHFLFNTLNTGMQLAIIEGADRTGEYMEYLARLFRHNIHNKDIIVPLEHEIEGLRYYFAILQVRFPKNLDLILDYDAPLLDHYPVPSSILQPLVENCIIHAFKGKLGKPLILVRAELRDFRLWLSVRDNGSGIPPETAAELLKPHGTTGSAAKLLGLENVIQRLYFFYPDDPDVIAIESEPETGTLVSIRIDIRKEPCIPQ
jgi:signal transduction histidine kinase